MTKNILILPLLACTVMHSMETNSLLEITKKSFNVTYCGTKINVTKESLFEISDKATMTVVGRHEQNRFDNKCDVKYEIIGTTYIPCSPIYQKHKDDESASDDDTYKPYYPSNYRKKTLVGYEKTLKNYSLVKITEPTITQFYHTRNLENTYQYNAVKRKANCVSIFTTEGNIEAIQTASEDLAISYKNVLIIPMNMEYLNAVHHIKNGSKATIALPPLGTDVGFPRDQAAPIAITTVLEFIRNNPNAYGTIYFYVKKRSDFARYKLLLMQHTGLLHKICLFYWAHKDQKNILSLLPKEIRDYIIQLI